MNKFFVIGASLFVITGISIASYMLLNKPTTNTNNDANQTTIVPTQNEVQVEVTQDSNSGIGDIVYVSYNGTATDDGGITGDNTGNEFHLFVANETKTTVYVISRLNYGIWTSQGIIPAQLDPMIQDYKMDIATSKKLDADDNSVDYYEITKLNSMVATEDY
jgi:hypothetical protein